MDEAWKQHNPGLTRSTLLSDRPHLGCLPRLQLCARKRGNRFIRKEDENSNYLKRVVRILHDHI